MSKGKHTITEVAQMVHKLAEDRGYHNPYITGEFRPITIGDFCSSIIGEVSEFYDSYRKGQIDPKELADVIIRVFDLAVVLGIDIEKEILEKHQYNVTRTDHSPEERRKPGGKKIL